MIKIFNSKESRLLDSIELIREIRETEQIMKIKNANESEHSNKGEYETKNNKRGKSFVDVLKWMI